MKNVYPQITINRKTSGYVSHGWCNQNNTNN